MQIHESRLIFDISDAFMPVKFDETSFYKQKYNKFSYSKGVDIVFFDEDSICLMEIKNCKGFEKENEWRLKPNNNQRVGTKQTVNGEEQTIYQIEYSLDDEVVSKVSNTLACFFGASTKSDLQTSIEQLSPYWIRLRDKRIKEDARKIRVIVFVEGEFGHKRQDIDEIFTRLRDSLKQKSAWLNCTISIENSSKNNGRFYTVRVDETK